MEPTTQPPFLAPVRPAPPAIGYVPQLKSSPIKKVVLWVGGTVFWWASVASSWFAATITAADEWGGGWVFTKGPPDPYYEEILLAIHISAVVIAIVPVIAVAFWLRRKNVPRT